MNRPGRPCLDVDSNDRCVAVSVTLPKTMCAKMDELRFKHYMNRSEFVRDALRQYIRGLEEYRDIWEE